MKLHELMEVMEPASNIAGYITVLTKAGSGICYQFGPGYVRHAFKDRDVVSVLPVINTKGDQTAQAGVVIIVNE